MSMPQPEPGKHYVLKHKRTGSNPFKGYVQITDVGFIGAEKIFLTSHSSSLWHFWEDYQYEYIGDLA